MVGITSPETKQKMKSLLRACKKQYPSKLELELLAQDLSDHLRKIKYFDASDQYDTGTHSTIKNPLVK